MVSSSSLNTRSKTFCGRIVQGQSDARSIVDQRQNCISQELLRYGIGLLACGGDRGVAVTKLIAQLGSTYPGGDGSASSRQDHTKNKDGESGG